MDDKDKIHQLEINQRNFKRENDRANSIYQRLIKELTVGYRLFYNKKYFTTPNSTQGSIHSTWTL
jgi:hypothetical protein